MAEWRGMASSEGKGLSLQVWRSMGTENSEEGTGSWHQKGKGYIMPSGYRVIFTPTALEQVEGHKEHHRLHREGH
ncbi:Hypothetical protein SMAX5B_010697 [Scophthalmus maximus]|uniref:Uncharacterized protein n=1 Tax=Scophthalmus maximus TaxID=52904 RepID=A0A2U9C8X3_SCOMX|nr:Hypothetical protein SMAX5B_010697 [Scophthalmus maximus]